MGSGNHLIRTPKAAATSQSTIQQDDHVNAGRAEGLTVPDDSVVPTHRRIIEAALTSFYNKGFAATGIREIADAAGISTASLYHYMGTKEDLLVHIMTEGLTRLSAAALLAKSEVVGPALQLVALVRVHIATQAIERRMSLVSDNEIRALTRPEDIVGLRDTYEALWQQTLADGAESGIFRLASPGLARLALIEMGNGVGRWFRPTGLLTLNEVCDEFSNMALALVQARDSGGEVLTIKSLGARSSEHEIGIVRTAFA